ncbi:MAG: tellurite resistance TerB family protein [Candidatus Sericytochromatia bacterium]|nr:tellurite resistance TerB family protein [Candidatus Sericytochromatia bacterium]
MTDSPFPAGPAVEHVTALLEIMTLMIRADGTIDHDEILQFMETIEHQAPFDEIGNAHLFRLAQQTGNLTFEGGVEGHLERLKGVLDEAARLRAYQLAWELSGADGHVDGREAALLAAIQRIFGLSDAQIASL